MPLKVNPLKKEKNKSIQAHLNCSCVADFSIKAFHCLPLTKERKCSKAHFNSCPSLFPLSLSKKVDICL